MHYQRRQQTSERAEKRDDDRSDDLLPQIRMTARCR